MAYYCTVCAKCLAKTQTMHLLPSLRMHIINSYIAKQETRSESRFIDTEAASLYHHVALLCLNWLQQIPRTSPDSPLPRTH